jgi:tetratricopeptide (TPR) repeat protein
MMRNEDAAGSRPDSPFEQPGERIGPYELVAPIGEGGYGTVWRAIRRNPYEQQVAIKIVKAGMDSAAVVARFEQERQTLARMDHPGIARVLDGGLTPRGRPCFVMELVEGLPIVDWCGSRGASARERVALLADVAEAVQHAHTKGVIHRDLKPSNVLVGVGPDGRPRAKVIDFGIAKALADDPNAGATMTLEGQVLGTAEYMSPEQADPDRAGEVDTRSDVYALGAILYELLGGRPPVGAPGASTRSRAETLRSAREGRILPLDDRGVPRELAWIAMRALRFAPGERYGSAADLARDLRAWLAGLAVEAAPASVWYRLRTFLRRNRAASAAAAAVTAALVAATAVSTRFALAERDARMAADAREAESRRLAEFQARVLGQLDPAWIGAEIRQDIVNRFNVVAKRAEKDPKAARTRVMTVFNELMLVNRTDVGIAMLDRWILDPMSAGAETEFKDIPLTEAAIRHGIANARWTMRQLAEARKEIDRALGIRRAALGTGDRFTLQSLALSAQISASEGRLDEAIRDATAALDGMRALGMREEDEVLFLQTSLGEFLVDRGEPDRAVAAIRAALDATTRLFGPEDVRTGSRRSSLGIALLAMGRIDEAEPHIREGHAIRVRTLGPDARYTIRAQLALGDLERARGQTEAARAAYEDALARSIKTDGSDHPQTIAARLRVASTASGAEARAQLEAALESARASLGKPHPDTIAVVAACLGARVAAGEREGAQALAAEFSPEAAAMPPGHPARRAFDAQAEAIARLGP